MVWTSELVADIDDAVTVLRLTVPMVPYRGTNFVTIDSEVLIVDGAGGGTLFIRRGALGTEPAGHTAGATITRYSTSTSGSGPHTHSESDVTNLVSDLSGKSATSHDHDGTYAPTHSHPYAATSHSHVDGDLPSGLARDSEVAAAYSPLGHSHGGGSESFPVGSAFIAFVSTDPATLLGYGTWASRGAGRVLVGRDTGQSGGDLIGAATHSHAAHSDHAALTHSGATVGNHNVTQPSAHTDVPNHSHPVTDPGHTHLTQRYPTATGSSSGFTIDTSMSGTLADNTLPTKTATTGVTTSNPAGGVSSQPHTGTAVDAHSVGQANQHAAQSHSAHDSVAHLPPAIVVYLWERTA